MNRLPAVLAAALLAAPLVSLALGRREVAPKVEPAVGPALLPSGFVPDADALAATANAEPTAPAFHRAEEDRLFADAVRVAWAYVEREYQPATGLINSVAGYPYATVWDIGSGLAALHSANRLGLLPEAEYRGRMRRALRTLAKLPLFEGAAFNKNYHIARAAPAGRNDRVRPARSDGYGWSAVDVGRLLVWLRIVAESEPELAADAEAVARRIRFDRLVRDGYLWGEAVDRRGGTRAYQEGRIGYEQYAAAGFALWGHRAEQALHWAPNAEQAEVLGIPIVADRRPGAHLTGEPFFLMGLELGWWHPEWRQQAERMLQAQQRRFQRTERLTMISEDALPIPPYFFYYYTLSDEEDTFAVRALDSGAEHSAPPWVSTKAAFAWYALMPGEYTWRVVEAVAERAGDPARGWSSGIYEASGRPTGSHNLNTAAVVLEAAVFHAERRPLLVSAGGAAP
jgi:hypothetical protein